ncbi:protein kinase domain-containing protein [Ditylenchus destructor]|uniref:NEK6-subfamily protein kinase n=1 Tax=Ditylenchus destructor TaxID=166010 RepID=A0AAD4NDU3_9BILA|nr:protein kinase domain-containing protein [Ditylenchus destructor]
MATSNGSVLLPSISEPQPNTLPAEHAGLDPSLVYANLENFELGKKIGKGQFSEVYRAFCPLTDEMVALKKIQLNVMKDKKAREDCVKEIDLLKKLDHDNIIRYYASFVIDKELNIVLELADAGDLNRLIKHFKKNHRLLPEKTIWKYFVQVMRGLAYMHSKSVMHRDIKPANVFITTHGVAKLGDLGLGRFFSSQTYKAHSIVGTPYYMSPERMHETGYNFKSDIWSVGCLLYEMAALQSPFYGEKMNLYALVRKIEKCEYPPVPSNIYSQQMRLLISNCICNNPAKRFDAGQVLLVAERMNDHFFQTLLRQSSSNANSPAVTSNSTKPPKF